MRPVSKASRLSGIVKNQGMIILTIILFCLALIFVRGFSGYFNLITLLSQLPAATIHNLRLPKRITL